MNPKTYEILEFNHIKTMLADLCQSNLGRKLVESLQPRTEINSVANTLRETTEARLIIDSSGSPPLYGLADIGDSLERLKIGGVLSPGELMKIADFLRGCRKTREFMLKRIDSVPLVAGYAGGIKTFTELEEEIYFCIDNDTVSSDASPVLNKARKEITRIQEKIRAKLQQILNSPDAKEILQEPVISIKDSRQVLMVKAAHKHRLPGIVCGSSASGSTLFVEPMAVHQLRNDLQVSLEAEAAEVYQILSTLSGQITEHHLALEQNMEIMAQYDFAFAKARLSRAMNGTAPAVNQKNYLKLISARHPLLSGAAIPLEIEIGQQYRSLVITGPNTGGKTVVLKTVGLLSLMAQSGMHIPADPGSEIAVFKEILADIGDGQNISQSLSTFSAHITNIVGIVNRCGKHSLVLLDEVGTGTDPAEGSAIAIAILKFLFDKGCITVASTHYPEIKTYALKNAGFKNGCMAFDRQNLKPLYQLIVGQPGESNALWIAEKLGMPRQILEYARKQLPKPEVVEPVNLTIETKEATIKKPEELASPTPRPQINVEKKESEEVPVLRPIKVGDQVFVPFLDEKGLVCTLPDARGKIRVMIKGIKTEVLEKRVKLLIPAEQLYPENYDLNIVLLSKEERKQKHQMERKHVPGMERIIQPDEQN